MIRKNDILWKGILEKVFEDLLRFVFPDVDKELDLQRGVCFLDKELGQMYPEPGKPSHTRVVDKLIKVYRRDGQERWMLTHIEVQGQARPEFARRMFAYYYRILDRYDQPVTAIAIFAGRIKKNIDNQFQDHCLGTHILYQYNTLYLRDYADEELAASENLFALVLLVAKKALLTGKDEEELDSKLLEQKLLIARLLLKRKDVDEEKINAIFIFLNNYLLFAKKETNRIFMEQVDQLTGKKKSMDILEQVAEIREKEGLQRGLQKGRAQERVKSVRAFLTNTKFSVEKIASILGVSTAFVEKQKKSLQLK